MNTKLPEISDEDRQFLHDNPNTSDVVEWVQEYAKRAVKLESDLCAERARVFARKWWSIHSASNKHFETTRKVHDDFCQLEAEIRTRSNA